MQKIYTHWGERYLPIREAVLVELENGYTETNEMIASLISLLVDTQVLTPKQIVDLLGPMFRIVKP